MAYPVLPPGVKVPINLPAYCDMPGQTDAQRDTNALIVAAFSTPMFPEAKKAGLALLNKSVGEYRYQRPVPKPNRQQRRSMARDSR